MKIRPSKGDIKVVAHPRSRRREKEARDTLIVAEVTLSEMAAVGKNFLFGSSGLKKWAYNLSGWNRYGLMRDDLLMETPVVQEALKRLPQHVIDERQFRMIRAMQLDCQKIVLPKEQWTKYEEDVKYLTPYVEEVERELKEKKEWAKE